MDGRYPEGLASDTATHKSEAKALLVLTFIMIVCIMGPFFAHDSIALGSVAPLAVWVFNLWLFGPLKIFQGGIFFVSNSHPQKAAQEHLLRSQLRVIGLSMGMTGETRFNLSVDANKTPMLVLSISNTSQKQIISNDPRLYALYDSLFGTQSRWNFLWTRLSFIEDLGTTSAHERIEAHKLATDAITVPKHGRIYRFLSSLPKGKMERLSHG